MLAFPYLSGMAELIWDGKYDEHGHKRAPVRIELPFKPSRPSTRAHAAEKV